jgi:hypothetical protein
MAGVKPLAGCGHNCRKLLYTVATSTCISFLKKKCIAMKKIFQQPVSEEPIIKNEPAHLVLDGANLHSGRLVLTTKRLMYGRDTHQEPELSIDLDTINKLEHKNLLTDNNILAVIYLQYNEARFSVLDYDAWEDAIESTRMTPHI